MEEKKEEKKEVPKPAGKGPAAGKPQTQESKRSIAKFAPKAEGPAEGKKTKQAAACGMTDLQIAEENVKAAAKKLPESQRQLVGETAKLFFALEKTCNELSEGGTIVVDSDTILALKSLSSSIVSSFVEQASDKRVVHIHNFNPVFFFESGNQIESYTEGIVKFAKTPGCGSNCTPSRDEVDALSDMFFQFLGCAIKIKFKMSDGSFRKLV